MNKKNVLIIVLISSFALINAKQYLDKKPKSTGQCYCSYKCGPRDANEPGDAPFIDPETGICFCQERDREKYFVHGCHKRHNAKIFNSCCAQQEQEASSLSRVKGK